MATRKLYRWYVKRYGATSRTPARAIVIVHGFETRFVRTYRVSEQYTISLTPELASAPDEALVARAMDLSARHWR